MFDTVVLKQKYEATCLFDSITYILWYHFTLQACSDTVLENTANKYV